MRSLKRYFEGVKDFSFIANEPKEKNCIRDVHFIHIRRFRSFVVMHIRANGFLRGMVRNIVGVLVSFSKNPLKIDTMSNIISQHKELKSFKAPAKGLFLSKVFYLRGVE
jgi:tRNA pseudouridine38-40 synthase